MTARNNHPRRVGNTWVFANGRTVPVVSGGADEPSEEPTFVVSDPPPASDSTTEERQFSSDDIAKARRQEKEKMYSELEKEKARRQEIEAKLSEFEKNMEAFNADKAEQQRLAAEAAAEAEAQRRAAEEEELSARELLQRREEEWEQKLQSIESRYSEEFASLRERAEAQEATLQKERAYAALREYRETKLAEHAEDIMPRLASLVTGNTEAEIDEAISNAIHLTSGIMEDVTQGMEQRSPLRGVPTTGASPTGPLENQTSTQTLTSEDIRNMSLEQYEQYRSQLLGQANPYRAT